MGERVKVCEVCQKPLGVVGGHTQHRFCSRTCRNAGFSMPTWGVLPPEPGTPLEWNGVTRYNDAHRGLRPYQVVCLQAGHVMQRVRLTEFQAARIVILGFKTRCGDCGGWLMLESDEDGRIGGGIQAHTVTGGHWWPESAA